MRQGEKGEVRAVPRFRDVLKLPPGFVSCLGRVRRGLGEGESLKSELCACSELLGCLLPLGSFPRWEGEVRPQFWCLFTRFLTERSRIPPACHLTPCCCALVGLFWLPLSFCSSPTASALSAARSCSPGSLAPQVSPKDLGRSCAAGGVTSGSTETEVKGRPKLLPGCRPELQMCPRCKIL